MARRNVLIGIKAALKSFVRYRSSLFFTLLYCFYFGILKGKWSDVRLLSVESGYSAYRLAYPFFR